MPANHTKSSDYNSLKSTAKNGGTKANYNKTLKHSKKSEEEKDPSSRKSLVNSQNKTRKKEHLPEPVSEEKETSSADNFILKSTENSLKPEEDLSYAEKQKHKKEAKKTRKNFELINSDFWLVRNGHTLTFIGLYLFSILVLFRPYEIVPAFSFLSATAFYFAAATLIVYFPTQLLTEGNFTTFSTEVKAIAALTLIALITMPIAKSPGTAWETFSDAFIKAVLMFIVMVNVLRTRRRLMQMMWLSLSIGVYLSYVSLDMYMRGELNSEGYRVVVEIGGLFGNPNDMALHLVMMTPLAITLGIAAQKKSLKIIYFAMAALFIGANMVTYSRGGFLALLAVAIILVWKLGRRNRLQITVISTVVSFIVLLFAPGNYGLRMLSIFIPGLDPVGSSGQRQELLIRSILVSIRNPWGIGIGNFPIVGVQNLQSHNAYTQISSELGILGLSAYLVFILSPLRKLLAIEEILFAKNEFNWFYYMAIGFQASIIAYMVSSFFGSVAYNWFIYYLIAYAVAFRRIYKIDGEEKRKNTEIESNLNNSLGLQTA